MGPDGVRALFKVIGSLTNLTSLDLSENDIGDEGMIAFCSVVKTKPLAKLRHLNLAKNNIRNKGIIPFSSVIAMGLLSDLVSLDLDDNSVSDSGIFAFVEAIEPMSKNSSFPLGKLKTLSVMNWDFTIESYQAFNDAIRGRRVLPELGFLLDLSATVT